MRQPGPRIRLAKAALLFSLDEYPDLDVSRYLARLTRLAREVGAEHVHGPEDEWRAMRTVLFDRHGYTGNEADYKNPANSYLHRVIDTRRGIPISLSVLWLDVAATLDWPLVGIGLPGHFVLRHERMPEDVYIDPFHGAALRSRGECAEMVRLILGASAPVSDAMFQPVDKRQTLRRMLGNLYAHYVNLNDWRRSADVLSRMVAVVPDEIPVRAELARVLTQEGSLGEAAEVLEEARELAVFEPEQKLIHERARELHRRRAELN
ncbi:MAG: hypothetical protein C4547_11655 [Phycisphaerales bacterium]|nr:MAG: hypothetical protein C4547_11655 [Phycisphaerales bacterium]